ncbi:MAG: sigma-54 interaction domain-containing protein [Opitutales bacterium]
MQVLVLAQRRAPALVQRLQGLGHRVQVLPPERLPSLEAKTLDIVCVVPFTETSSAAWPEDRVRLARASRYYVVVGDNMNTRQVMMAARDGAHDALCTSDDDARWTEALEGAARSQQLWWQLYGAQTPIDGQSLVGRSGAMKSLRESIQRIGPTDATVLIMGESGTGKERVAESIHGASGRGAFITVNCAAIPAELMESELFGVEKGAYTGANRSRPGLVEEAAGGTLFLDEIGEMDFSLQPKLLRFLETRRARRVGSTREYQCLVRVVSATNRELRRESENGRFRLDLYYRLSEVILNTPPLRHRPDDIPDLARLFLEGAAERMGKNFERLEPELIHAFQQYAWPGNVRELKQAIERMAIHYDGPVMRASFWAPPELEAPAPRTRAPFPVSEPEPAPRAAPQPAGTAAPFSGAPAPASWGDGGHGSYGYGHGYRPMAPSKREKYQIASRLIEESDGDLGWVAAQLGIHPTTLYRWRKSGKV